MAPTEISLEDLIALAEQVSVFDEAEDLDELIEFVRETNVCFTGTTDEVTTACNGNCCPFEDFACDWEGEATVCPGSCLGSQA